MNWERLFKPHILERGMAYYCLGRVEDLEIYEDEITAVVEGSEPYDVSIELDEDGVSGMECTCPYAEGGENCKHMAAVLYAWQGKKTGSRGADAQIREAVERADEALVRRFLVDALLRDDRLCRRFMIEAQPDGDPSILDDVEAAVDAIVDKYMADGYIDYYEADNFVSELLDILEDEAVPRMEHGQDGDAFRVSTFVFLALNDVDMDDSNGGVTMVVSACSSIWEQIAERADDDLQQEMFDWLTANSDDTIADYLEGCCADTLMRSFDAPKYTEKLLNSEQEALDRELGSKNDSYLIRRCIQNCVRLMEKRGDSAEAVDAWLAQYRTAPFGRKMMIERCRRAGKWAETVALLKEALDQKEDPLGSEAYYHLQLKDAYAALGWTDEYRNALWKIVTEIAPANMDVYREYRSLFEPENWIAERERLFAALPRYADVAALYADEELYDRLLERALAQHGTYLLKQYENVLVKRYPEQVLGKYADAIKAEARTTADRTIYRGWVATLKHMRKISGGEAIVNEIVKAWRAEYPRRRAMMEELDQL